jgi:carbon-monoxide dehydrogenase medium subunit
MKPVAFDYRRARDVAEACEALAEPGDGKAMAGGCSLGPMLNLRLARPSLVVDLRAAADLRTLIRSADTLTIGACWTHAEIEDGVVPEVTGGFMRQVAKGIAYRPVRNRGTIGGSLAHADPAADWVNALAALDAELIIAGRSGARRERLSSFFLGAYATTLAADEVITAVAVPILSEGARWSYHKICRKTGEFAMAIGAAVVDPVRGLSRVICGATEAAPLLLPKASAALLDEPAAAAALAADEIEQGLAGHDAVFRQLHAVAVERALAELAP